MANDVLLAVSVIVALTAVSKLLGNWYGIPNVVFLLGFGVLVGPEGLGFLGRSLATDELSFVVGFTVAVIVFEGALSLTLTKLRTTPRATLLLVTVGAALTFVGMGLAVRGLLGLAWPLSLVVAALLVATGPMVVTPVVEQLTVSERVASPLETEGIVDDVTAAVLGSALFSVTLLSSRSRRLDGIVVEFVTQFATGALVGLALGLVAGYVLRTGDHVTLLEHADAIDTAVTLLTEGVKNSGPTSRPSPPGPRPLPPPAHADRGVSSPRR